MKPLPWSWTALNNLQQCPHKHHEVAVLKRVSDAHDANDWGTWVHKQIEQHYRKGVDWPSAMLPYVPHVKRAVAWAGEGPRYIELKIGISRALGPVDFFRADVWGRGVIDFATLDPDAETMHMIDWKAGKVKPNSKQLALFAIFGFTHFPRAHTIHTSFEWLQFGTETRETFTRNQLGQLWHTFLPDLAFYKETFNAENWFKKPSGLCRGWCPVADCEHWTPRRDE